MSKSQLNTVKDLGAVFTPHNIVNQMLDTLPDKVWKRSSRLRWLEPTSERYQFMISICQWGLFRTERKLIEYFGYGMGFAPALPIDHNT